MCKLSNSKYRNRVFAGARRRSSVGAVRADRNSLMEVVMKKLVALFMIFVVGLLAGCNTMQGLGKDIERGGEKLQDSAHDAKQRM